MRWLEICLCIQSGEDGVTCKAAKEIERMSKIKLPLFYIAIPVGAFFFGILISGLPEANSFGLYLAWTGIFYILCRRKWVKDTKILHLKGLMALVLVLVAIVSMPFAYGLILGTLLDPTLWPSILVLAVSTYLVVRLIYKKKEEVSSDNAEGHQTKEGKNEVG